jgi:hypothetical protein
LAKHDLPHLSAGQIDESRFLVQSFDVYRDSFGTSMHLYQRTGDIAQITWPMRLPVMSESCLVYASMQDLCARFSPFMYALGYTDTHMRQRLADLLRGEYTLYACVDACVQYKLHEGRPCFFMMYIGITLMQFQAFLTRHAYPASLIAHVHTYPHHYEDLAHEIAIVYDADTLQVVRTAFYGATEFVWKSSYARE